MLSFIFSSERISDWDFARGAQAKKTLFPVQLLIVVTKRRKYTRIAPATKAFKSKMLIFNNFLLHLKKNQRLFLSLEKVTSYYYIYYYSRFDDLIKSLNSLIFGLFSNMRSDQQISAQFQTDEISIFLNNVRREKWQFNVVNRTIFLSYH